MRSNGKGGMQTSAQHARLTCPKCNKAAFRREDIDSTVRYSHFSKGGVVIHILDCASSSWSIKRSKSQ